MNISPKISTAIGVTSLLGSGAVVAKHVLEGKVLATAAVVASVAFAVIGVLFLVLAYFSSRVSTQMSKQPTTDIGASVASLQQQTTTATGSKPPASTPVQNQAVPPPKAEEPSMHERPKSVSQTSTATSESGSSRTQGSLSTGVSSPGSESGDYVPPTPSAAIGLDSAPSGTQQTESSSEQGLSTPAGTASKAENREREVPTPSAAEDILSAPTDVPTSAEAGSQDRAPTFTISSRLAAIRKATAGDEPSVSMSVAPGYEPSRLDPTSIPKPSAGSTKPALAGSGLGNIFGALRNRLSKPPTENSAPREQARNWNNDPEWPDTLPEPLDPALVSGDTAAAKED